MKRYLVLVVILVSYAAPSQSADWLQTQQACKNMIHGFTRFTAEDCGLKVFGLEPVGPEIKNIASGSGLGGGIRFIKPVNHGHLQSDVLIRGLISTQHFSLAEGRYDLHVPAPLVTSDQVTISFFGHRLDLAHQDFYGQGPASSLSGRAGYRQREIAVGASGYLPVLSWLAVGGGIRYASTAIKGTFKTDIPKIQNVYSDTTAPGLKDQPSFLELQLFVRFRTPTNTTHTWQNHDARFTYEHFGDQKDGTQSFDRFSGTGSARYELRVDSNNPFHRSFFQNVLCEQIAGRQCRIGYIGLKAVVTASHGSHGVVPFYLQETLGGADFNGVDTLRGFVDYRFRAPDRIVLQGEFEKPVWGPLGVYGFYDMGNVALSSSDLSLHHLRHDVGIGLLLRGGDKVVLRAYIAFGGGEGSHPNAKALNAF